MNLQMLHLKTKSDEELMILIQNGSKKAFNELYERYAKKILYFFYSKLAKDIEKSNDFLQDLFIKIIEKPESFDTEKRFSTWVFKVAYNMCKNEYKRNAIWTEKVEHRMIDSLSSIEEESFIDRENNELLKNNLTSELEKLKEPHKTVFILKYKEGLTVKEISEVMNCSEGTIKSRLFYTLKKLSVGLKQYKPIV